MYEDTLGELPATDVEEMSNSDLILRRLDDLIRLVVELRSSPMIRAPEFPEFVLLVQRVNFLTNRIAELEQRVSALDRPVH